MNNSLCIFWLFNLKPIYLYITTTDCIMVVIERDENTNIPCFRSINSFFRFLDFGSLFQQAGDNKEYKCVFKHGGSFLVRFC